MGITGRRCFFLPLAAVLALMLLLPRPGTAAQSAPQEALGELSRIRTALKVSPDSLTDRSKSRLFHGRPALELEGWREADDGALWPVDQATFDLESGLIAKYVNFTFASKRKAGEEILPMGAISNRADGYLRLFYPGRELDLEQIERKRVIGKDGIYYELWYSPQPQDVPFFHPLVKLLVDASTGRFYRTELAPDYLGVGRLPGAIISRSAARRLAGVYLRMADLAPYLGSGASLDGVQAPELSFVRPNTWLGGVPGGGTARAAWVVPFRITDNGETSSLLFIDAAGGRILGGVPAPPVN